MLWKVISEVIETKKAVKNSGIESLNFDQMNDHFIDTPLELSNNFNNELIFKDLNPFTVNSYTLPNVNESDVQNIISKLDNNKSIGFDGIKPQFLKISTSLTPIIT